MTVQLGVLLAVTSIAAATDVRTRRIPNVLTAAAAVAAIVLHVPDGVGAVALALAAMMLAFALGSLAFSAGWFGGGDVKLVAVCCGLVGFNGAMWLVLDVFVAGALLVIVSAAARGRLFALVRSTAAVATHRLQPVGGHTVPYAVAIAAGSFVYVFSTIAPALRFPV